jgi:putative oxidoreductase
MNFKNIFQLQQHNNVANLALLILRIFTGVAFIYHGMGKIQAPFHWIPEGSNVHAPSILQFLAAVSEFGGGIALILGLVVPLAALGIFCTMIFATFTHAVIYKDPFINLAGGTSYELPLGYLVISIVLIALGPGNFSLDRYIFGRIKS